MADAQHTGGMSRREVIRTAVAGTVAAGLATLGIAATARSNAVRENVKHVTRQLRAAKPILEEFVKKGKVKVVGARYDLASGAVDIVA